jgi:hypothetical protein
VRIGGADAGTVPPPPNDASALLGLPAAGSSGEPSHTLARAAGSGGAGTPSSDGLAKAAAAPGG